MIFFAFSGVRFAAKILKHAVGLLLLCWQRMFRAALIAGFLGIVLTEISAMVSTGNFPTGQTHLVAAALAIALGYGAAVTVALVTLFANFIETVQMLMGEAEAGAKSAAEVADHVTGDIWDTVRGLIGLGRRKPRSTPASSAAHGTANTGSRGNSGNSGNTGASSAGRGTSIVTKGAALAAAGIVPIAAATRAARQRRRARAAQPAQSGPAAPQQASQQAPQVSARMRPQRTLRPQPPQLPQLPQLPQRAPRTRPPTQRAMPVPASQLPRIRWSYEEPTITRPALPAIPPTPAGPPIPPMPPIPTTPTPVATWPTPAQPPQAAEGQPTQPLQPAANDKLDQSVPTSYIAPVTLEPSSVPIVPIVPIQTQRSVPEPEPMPTPPPEPEPEPRPDSPTRPLGGTSTIPLGSTTHPLDRTTRPLRRSTRPLTRPRDTGNGLWQRLGSALVGHVDIPDPIPPDREPTIPDGPATTNETDEG